MKRWLGEAIFRFFDWLDSTEHGFTIMSASYLFGSIFVGKLIAQSTSSIEETQVKVFLVLLALLWGAPFIIIWRVHVWAKRMLKKTVQTTDRLEPRKIAPETHNVKISEAEKSAMEVLGLTHPYTEQELKNQRKALIAKTHPDQGGTAFLMRQVEEAFQLLKSKT